MGSKANGSSCPARSRRSGGKLSEDDLKAADGHAEYLVGKLQERCGWTRERAGKEVREFSDRL